MRFNSYVLVTLCSTVGVVAHAWLLHNQFFAAAVHLYTSKLARLILMNGAFVMACLSVIVLKKLFLGTPGTADIEAIVSEHLRNTLVDTLLMMTIFREDLNTRFVALFCCLLFTKTFHLLAEGRMDKMAQAPSMFSAFSHVRLSALLLVLVAVDGAWMYYCLEDAFETGPSVLVLFLLEVLICTKQEHHNKKNTFCPLAPLAPRLCVVHRYLQRLHNNNIYMCIHILLLLL
eukprot:TRINITY_DN3443_c0_g1_i2.p1 TRINITY_DN3443_c0_g1~~TRINITY_DN3443_c0_g1_i2.p1  ORF type:complete len:231 (-),score=50.28 TRINITY_DN3443_c0_g1_i2:527-1219(-)